MTTPRLVLIGLVVAAAGCHRTAQSAPDADDGDAATAVDKAAAVAPDMMDDAGQEVAPPPAVVAADPNIPLNEAVVGTPTLPADYSTTVAPPASLVENQPPQPETDDTWVPGYWWWSGPLARYVWVSGAWRHPPPDQVWYPGAWNNSGGRYVWAPGYWGPHGFSREVVDAAPPPLRYEVRPAAPGADFVWTPGYYGYRGGSYAWVGGSWARPPSAGMGWVEPRYVASGGRYVLQPGRWDFAPERRGTVFAPDINARPGARVTFTPVAPTVVVAHTNFVAQSSRAVALGATRTPTGSFVLPTRPRVEEHAAVNVDPHVDQHIDPQHVDPQHVEQRPVEGHEVVHPQEPAHPLEQHIANEPHAVETHAAQPNAHAPAVDVHHAAPPPVVNRPQARPQDTHHH